VSLRNSVRAARESARVIRDVLSLETWEEVNELYLWIGSDQAEKFYKENREQFYRRVRRSTQLVLGLVRSTMLHDGPMSFLWLGVMLERVGQTARTLDMHHHTMTREVAHQQPRADGAAAPAQIVEVALWLSLLRACSGYEAFVKKSRGRVTAQSVVSFLLFDTQFPRSLRYCLRSARSILGGLWPESRHGGIGARSYRAMDALAQWLDEREAGLTNDGIHELLTQVVDETGAICSHVTEEMLGPPRPPRVATQSQTQ
jgi:uncharacterized alpha-E superfamily protein